MLISKNGKRLMACVMSLAMLLSGLLYIPKAASAADNVKVLGATLRLSNVEVDNNSQQSMRIGIEVPNASQRKSCQIKVSVNGKSKVISTEPVGDGVDIQHNKILSYDAETDTVVYAIVIAGIKKDNFNTNIEVIGQSADLAGDGIHTSPMTSRNVMGVVDNLKNKYPNLEIGIDDNGNLVKKDNVRLELSDLEGYDDTKLEPSTDPYEPKDVDIQDESNYQKMGEDTVVTNNEDGSITLTSEKGSDGLMVKLPDGIELKSGDSVKIHLEVADLEGNSPDARVYLIPGENDNGMSNQLHSNAQGILDGVLIANGDVDHIFIKVASYGQKFNKLTIKRLIVTPIKSESKEEPKNVLLDLSTIQITDGSTKEVQEDGSVVITCNGKYTGGITIAIPEELQEGAQKISIEIDAENEAGEKVGVGQLKCEFDGEEAEELFNWKADSYDDTVFTVIGKKPTKLTINNQDGGSKFIIKKIEVLVQK